MQKAIHCNSEWLFLFKANGNSLKIVNNILNIKSIRISKHLFTNR